LLYRVTVKLTFEKFQESRWPHNTGHACVLSTFLEKVWSLLRLLYKNITAEFTQQSCWSRNVHTQVCSLLRLLVTKSLLKNARYYVCYVCYIANVVASIFEKILLRETQRDTATRYYVCYVNISVYIANIVVTSAIRTNITAERKVSLKLLATT